MAPFKETKPKICPHCKIVFQRKRHTNDILEAVSNFERRRFCSAECSRMGKAAILPLDEVKRLYELGHTQEEVGKVFGVTQRVIFKFMRRHKLKARIPFKRNQWGSANSTWKSNAVNYTTLHNRVEAARGKPKRCEDCGTEDPTKRYEWANLTKDYANVNDYRRLCKQCHVNLDKPKTKHFTVNEVTTIKLLIASGYSDYEIQAVTPYPAYLVKPIRLGRSYV